MRCNLWLKISLATLALLVAAPALAGEWTNWRGPHQNGVADATGLPDSWSKDGENLVWRQDFTGRSTMAVFDGRACAMGRVGAGPTQQEVVECWDAATGEPRWRRTFNVYNTTVPFQRAGWASVAGDMDTGYLYAHGVDGHLWAFDRDGETVWEWSLGEDVGRFSGYGGRTHSPIVDEDRVILSVIGSSWGEHRPGLHRYFAFDKRTGEVLWTSSPGGRIFDRNTYSTPVVALIDGQRLVIGGNADGHIYAVKARTGEPVWSFQLSQRGVNASVVVEGTTVFAAHSEENVDTGVMGRVVAIDGTGQGNVTATHELWRTDYLVGYASPLYVDGRLYVADNSANLHALDPKTGASFWEFNYGNVGKASPVDADGKIYLPEVNGNFSILRPGDEGATELDREFLAMPDGRYAEIYASPAVAGGRIYFTTDEGVYCLGLKDAPADFGEASPGLVEEPAPAGTAPAVLQLIPAEVVVTAGDPVSYRAKTFDAKGRFLADVDVTLSLDGLKGQLAGTTFTGDPAAGTQTGKVVAKAGDLTAVSRLRVIGPLPWSEDFSGFEVGASPALWLSGGRGKVAELEGEKVLNLPRAPRGVPRTAMLMGDASMAGYTIQADVLATQQGRRRADVGLINSGYTIDLQGNHQRLQLRSWAAMLRMAVTRPFEWEMDRWYTIKLRVDSSDEKAQIRGKVWLRGEPEPAEWSIEAEDALPIQSGSPGLYGYSPVGSYFDNIKVVENR